MTEGKLGLMPSSTLHVAAAHKKQDYRIILVVACVTILTVCLVITTLFTIYRLRERRGWLLICIFFYSKLMLVGKISGTELLTAKRLCLQNCNMHYLIELI